MQIGSGANQSQTWVTKGVWKDYVFDYQVFAKLWTEAENNPTLTLNEVQNYFAIFVNEIGEGSIYIDKIMVENENLVIESKDNGSNDIVFD